MSTSDYRPTVAETFYREHKALMEEAAQPDEMQKQADTPPAQTGNRKERRRKTAQARKESQ